jgi:prepilin-type N-terminal cleavage/methylation domain-containing protein
MILTSTRNAPSRAGFTLLEVMVSMAIFAGILTIVGIMVSTATDGASLMRSMTSQNDAERISRLIRRELSTSGVGGGGRLKVLTTREVEYASMESSQALFDPAEPYTAPWTDTLRVIKFEQDGDEILDNGLDDDGDYLIDEGRIALYSRDAGVDTSIAVLAHDVGDLVFTLETSLNRPRLSFVLRVDRIIINAVKDQDDVDQLLAGAGPRITHTVNSTITLIN